MRNLTLTLIRGLPGSGKTTYAKHLQRLAPKTTLLFATDDFWEERAFSPRRLQEAHQWNQRRVRACIKAASSEAHIVVHNTFSRFWELAPYLEMVDGSPWKVFVVDLFDGGCTDHGLSERCVHDVPLHTITNMRQRWQP
jgi:hypothetical protein